MPEKTLRDFYKKKNEPLNWLSNILMGVGGGLTGQDYIGNAQAAERDRAEMEFKQYQLENPTQEDIIKSKGEIAKALTEQVTAGVISPQQANEQFYSIFGDSRPVVNTTPTISPVVAPTQIGVPPLGLSPQQAMEGFRAKGLNAMGVPTGYEPDPVAEDRMKDLQKSSIAAEKGLSGTETFLKQFERSYNELKTKYPEFGDTGFIGFMTRQGASIATALDSLPETKAFQVELKPLANQMARDIEGGRVTDQDRQIYADSFANTLRHPNTTNIRLVSNKLIDMSNKGADISKVLVYLSKSNTDIIQSIVDNVIKEKPELAAIVFQANPDAWEVVK